MTKANHIPGDIILPDILLRLPSLSLLRFKTVCKSWNSLISDHDFIKLQQRPRRDPKILFTTNGNRLPFGLLDLESSSLDQSCLSLPFNFPMETPYHMENSVKILGSSHGLVSLLIGCARANKLYLCNPSTRESRIILDMYPPPATLWHGYSGHGLGYDPVSNDLKLVVTLYMSLTAFKVFSMKLNSWTVIRCSDDLDPPNPPPSLVDTQAIVLNGVFHWLTWNRYSRDHSIGIVAFDSKQDKLLEMPLPPVAPLKCSHANLLRHKESLCMSFFRIKGAQFKEIWMLKEHEWIPFLNVPTRMINRLECDIFWPTFVCRSGTQIILRSHTHIMSFKEETRDKISTQHPYEAPAFEATMCVDTLVSPNHIHTIGSERSI